MVPFGLLAAWAAGCAARLLAAWRPGLPPAVPEGAPLEGGGQKGTAEPRLFGGWAGGEVKK